MRVHFSLGRTWALLLALLLGQVQAAVTVSDPWPGSPVLTRLFRLDGTGGVKRSDTLRRMQQALGLSAQQMQQLRQLGALEQQSARLGDSVTDRLQARQVNAQIAANRQKKDAQARQILGSKYPAFRQWLRGWWQAEVKSSQVPVVPAGQQKH